MTPKDIRHAAQAFADYWQDKGYEKGESQPFWMSLLRDILGVEKPEEIITFEEQVKVDRTNFIDGHIPSTHVLIEQKSRNVDLRSSIRQSDGTFLTPYQQAQRYSAALPYSQRPRWIITCNFKEFFIYDMETPNCEPDVINVCDLAKEYYRLQFIVDKEDDNIKREMEVSIQAGNLVGILYDEILKQYKDPTNPEVLRSLNMLCVRLVFCLYAEDAGIFGSHGKFNNYIKSFPANKMRLALIELFKVLDTKIEDRDPYLEDVLAEFPYVNGGLFADESIIIPQMNEQIRELLLSRASADFDWSAISPTIFGAVFESTLNPETRRSGGMHYTSIENIHKVIDPLFLDELNEEFENIKQIKVTKNKEAKLREFQNKLASLKFLDPACGSGNFLTETYLSLRRLENKIISALYGEDQMLFWEVDDVVKVSIGQFYGIEINDFAVTVAKTALWIAESQMLQETEDIINRDLNFLPLKSYANIVEGNALRIDWETVVPKNELNYIMGNPPFVGMKYQNAIQKDDMSVVFKSVKNYGSLVFVASWYYKSALFIQNTGVRVAFVSTNSITQGEQAAILWDALFNLGVVINFAHRTFIWNSEANIKAAVHCVIIGFSLIEDTKKLIYAGERSTIAQNINPYLLDAPNILVQSRTKPLCNVPKIIAGNKPVDGDHLKIESEDYIDFLKKEPRADKFIKKLVGGYEFINNVDRYVLWLVDASPAEIKSMPLVYDRVKKVREARLNMKDAGAIKLADTPTTFRDTLNPDQYVVVPIVSSENRRYVPMGFLDSNSIPTNQVQIIPEAEIYHFGILISNVHMSWMRAVCGRLKSDYRYTGKIVYNNFPWPTPTAEQKATIEKTAQEILDARALYPDCSLADLYDELTMPTELRKAHQRNDQAVMRAYGFWGKVNTESECVAELMRMYEELTK